MVHLESGDLKNSRCQAEKALKLSQMAQQIWIEGFAWILLGRIRGKSDQSQVGKAEGSILKGIVILEKYKLKALYAQGYHYLGELYATAGPKDKTSEPLQVAENLFREMGMDSWLAKNQQISQVLEG